MSKPRTRFIVIDTKLCQACASCKDACPQGALGMVAFLWHRHARVDRANACTGCRKCIRTCSHGAITAIAMPATCERR